MDTEEHIDLWFYRPVGFFWAKVAEKMGVTPNVITIASIFLGIGAGVAFYFNNMWINVLGMLLLVWANSFDSADGQLARLTGQYSRLGRILDGMAGDIWFATIYVAICLRENVTSDFFMAHPWVIWVMAGVTGLCHAKQASMADYYRQFHLYFLKGKKGSELEDLKALRHMYASTPWKGNFWKKIVQIVYISYTRQQEGSTRAMQQLRALIMQRFPGDEIPAGLRDDFRRRSLPLMKYTNILSFNWRCITLFVSLFLKMPWIYFACELVIFNVLMLYMRGRHERLCRGLTDNINQGKYGCQGTDI